jgi:hypothetical protein
VKKLGETNTLAYFSSMTQKKVLRQEVKFNEILIFKILNINFELIQAPDPSFK